METNVCISIPTSKFLQLATFLEKSGSSYDPVEIIPIAIDYWLDNAEWKKEDLLPDVIAREKGYSWKQVFLPHGTLVRMRYKGTYHYARIEGDKFLFESNELSPSEFARNVTGTNRNAWRDLEIRKPDDAEWILADDLR